MTRSALSPLLETLKAVMAGVSEPAEMLRLILDNAVNQTDADRGVFVEVLREGELAFRVLHRMKHDALTGPAGEFSHSIFKDVIQHGKGMRLDNAAATTRYADVESVRAMKLVSILCLPLLSDGEVVALVHLESSRTGHFTRQHQQLVSALLEMVTPAYEVLLAGRGVIEERDALRETLREERSTTGDEWSFARFIGRSPAVRNLEETVRKAAPTEFPVLLLGETGTGKGILARILHHASRRANGPFVTVFCPSLERSLVESELFGHVRGAFTGADQDRAGKVEAATGGTLFLDEIGELPGEIQPKILRLLQEKAYERRGEAAERLADVRIIAATNRDLQREVVAGNFRRDLYERLNYVPVRVPALRERVQDIPLLLRHALDRLESGRWIEWEEEVPGKLTGLDHLWPGNVRETEQLAARLSMEQFDGPLNWAVVEKALGGSDTPAVARAELEQGLPELMRQSERTWLEAALARYPELSRRQLAEHLHISEATLYAKLKAHGLGSQSA